MSTTETPWFVLLSPELGKKFQDFHEVCNDDGVLDKKTKELLKLVLASVFRSPYCTEAHIKAALEMGISREEITEALLIAALEGAGTQLAWAKEIFIKYLGNHHKE